MCSLGSFRENVRPMANITFEVSDKGILRLHIITITIVKLSYLQTLRPLILKPRQAAPFGLSPFGKALLGVQ